MKTWAIHSTTLTFQTEMGGWSAAIDLTLPEDPATSEPTATDSQKEATAKELVDILAEFKGPDREVKQY